MTKSKRKANLLFVLLMIAIILFSFIACDDSDDDSSSSDSSDSSGSIIEVSTVNGLATALKEDGATVRLTKDIKLTSRIAAPGADVTLDLNGYTLSSSVSTDNSITIRGSLTITGNGTIKKDSNYDSHMIYVYGGSLTIESGTFVDEFIDYELLYFSASSYNDNVESMIYMSDGSITIKAGTFKAYGKCLLQSSGGTVVIEGGRFYSMNAGLASELYLENSSVAITGGNFKYGYLHYFTLSGCEGLDEGSAVEISGAYFQNIYLIATDAIIYNSTISSATNVSDGSSVTLESDSFVGVNCSDGSHVTIKGGTGATLSVSGTSSTTTAIEVYDGTFSGSLKTSGDNASITLYGGSYSANPADYLADGYTYIESIDDYGDPLYIVVSESS